jgi:UDP-N-acetylglucosamine 2-epimerase (non-hydrolysing)
MQTGKMLMEIEDVLINEKPDIVIVQGDTNSTLAGALAASKLQIPVAHVEAGCRSFDRRMPEEINRVMVDHISDFLFAPDEIAYQNLINEGITPEKIYMVGNTSVDACLRTVNLLKNEPLGYSLEKKNYILLTLHRQDNTSYEGLKEILSAINIISDKIMVLFPAHLRTRKIIEDYQMTIDKNVIIMDPIGYKDFMELLTNSKFVMTDSGGIQEECAVLNIPCLILRDNTEWMVYVEIGKNMLLGVDQNKIVKIVMELLDNDQKLVEMSQIPININRDASKAIISILKNFIQ